VFITWGETCRTATCCFSASVSLFTKVSLAEASAIGLKG
jgi:hypothetical protein